MSIPIVPVSIGFSDAELFLLKKKIKFSVIPANILATEIIAKNVKSAVRPLNVEQADTVQRVVFMQYPSTRRSNKDPHASSITVRSTNS